MLYFLIEKKANTVPTVRCLYIDGSDKLLNLVQQMVAFLDHILVLSVLLVGARGLYNIPNFVDLGVETAGSDETGQLGIQQLGGDAEGRRHRR